MVTAVAPRPTPSLATVDGSRMRLHLHPGQQRAWRSTKRFVAVIAGSQSGKTSFAPHWLRREITLCGPGDYMVVTPTFPLLEIKALPEFRRLFEDQLQLGTYKSSPVRQFVVSPAGEVRLFGGPQDVPTKVWFGYAADPDSLESATLKGLVADECGQKRFKLTAWQALQRRLALNEGRALLVTTPYDLGWLYSEIWQPWLKADGEHPYIDVVNFDSTTNPAFSRAEYDRIRSEMPSWKFDLFYRGIFTRPAGLIYGNWDESFVIDRFPIPDHWPRFMGVDFGGVNTAALFTAVELDADNRPTGRLIHYREYLAGELSAAEHTRVLLKPEPVVPTAIGGAPSEGQWRREFAVAGLPIYQPPISEVEIGIDRVYATHEKREIVVFNDLYMYLEQKRTYSRVLDERGEPTEKIEDKETYHVLDCERYEVSHLRRPPGRKPGVR